ncbi:hypothetical protein, partial [Burkholderia humptydooensis]
MAKALSPRFSPGPRTSSDAMSVRTESTPPGAPHRHAPLAAMRARTAAASSPFALAGPEPAAL